METLTRIKKWLTGLSVTKRLIALAVFLVATFGLSSLSWLVLAIACWFIHRGQDASAKYTGPRR